ENRAAEVDDDVVAFAPDAAAADSQRVERASASTCRHQRFTGGKRIKPLVSRFGLRRKSLDPELGRHQSEQVLRRQQLARARHYDQVTDPIAQREVTLPGKAERNGTLVAWVVAAPPLGICFVRQVEQRAGADLGRR